MGNMGEMQILGKEKSDKNGNVTMRDEWFMDVILEDLEKPKYRVQVDPYLFKNHYSGAGKLKPLEESSKFYGLYSDFDWSYLITTHKAQGSSFNNVTIIDDSEAFKESAAKWLYTSIT